MKIILTRLAGLFLFLLWATFSFADSVEVPPQGVPDTASKPNQPTLEAIQEQRREVVSLSLALSEEEAKAFWPLYDDYRSAMTAVIAGLIRVLVDFANDYETETFTRKRVRKILDQYYSIEEAKLTLKKKYVKKFIKVLPPDKVMRYFQLENKMDAIIQAELYVEFPLAQLRIDRQ